jgi:hypothetical protein
LVLVKMTLIASAPPPLAATLISPAPADMATAVEVVVMVASSVAFSAIAPTVVPVLSALAM